MENTVTVEGFTSEYHRPGSFDDAGEKVKDFFSNFEDLTLERMTYAGDGAVREEAAYRGARPEHTLVLKTVFTTGAGERSDVFEPQTTYRDYGFIFLKEKDEDSWVLTDHGYA